MISLILKYVLKYKTAAIISGGVVVVLAAFVGAYQSGKSAGTKEMLDILRNERIQVLKDGKRIDEKVDKLDDDGLCKLLGGCL